MRTAVGARAAALAHHVHGQSVLQARLVPPEVSPFSPLVSPFAPLTPPLPPMRGILSCVHRRKKVSCN